MISERVIENVVNDQFISALDGIRDYDSLEFSGFGNFYFKSKRALYKMKGLVMGIEKIDRQLENEDLSVSRRKALNSKRDSYVDNLELLKTKTDE